MNNSKLINRFINWLKKPYYFNDSNQFKIKASVGIGILVFILLVFFRPVNAKIVTINPYLFKLGFGVITTLNLLFFFFVFAKFFPNFFNNETWTIGKHFITIISLITFASTIRWGYLYVFFPKELYSNNINLLKMIFYSFTIGSFPILVFIYFDEKYQSKKYRVNNNDFKKNKIKKFTPRNEFITISATNQKDSITFILDNLVYIYSESNYACMILKDENKRFREEILRIPLHTVEKKLENYNQILRCHKSYIVNTDYVYDISGNARGYTLHLKNNVKNIPVSRKFTKEQLQEAI